MKQVFISGLAEGVMVTDWFMVQSCASKLKKNGEPYVDMVLSDRTGSLTVKDWSGSVAALPGAVIKAEIKVSSYKDALQGSLSRWRLHDESQDPPVSLEDFLPASTRDRGEMLRELEGMVAAIGTSELRDSCLALLTDSTVRPRLRDCPAAQTKHQPYLGGLLEHVLSMAAIGRFLGHHFEPCGGDLGDYLVAAAIWHDIGKIEELEFGRAIAYTRAGKLHGHILQGAILFEKIAKGILQPDQYDRLLHMIASHHGRPDWGAVKVPATREAILFHLIDAMDAWNGILDQMQKAADSSGWTGYNAGLGTALYFPRNAVDAGDVESV